MSPPAWEVHVVIPAHDEVDLIGACLGSVVTAARRLRERHVRVASVLVVADRCTDGTVSVVAEVARAAGRDPAIATLEVDAGCVGRARALGVRRVLSGARGAAARTWVAMTDADSTVDPDWLVGQVREAEAGSGLVVGSVRPDPASLSAPVLQAWEARHAGTAELHVHGANLGFSAEVYRRAGGFPPLAEDEDVAFVGAAIGTGARWVRGPASVRTSGRTVGRTDGGFAGYVRTLVAELDAV